MSVDNTSYRVTVADGTQTSSWRFPGPSLSLRCTMSGSWLVGQVVGELDLQAVPLLDALGSNPCFVVLDLRGVTFMDCSGLRALLDTRHRAVAAGGAAHLAAPSRCVVDLLRLTHLGRAFPVFDTVGEASTLPSGAGSDCRETTLVRPRRSGEGRRGPV